MSAHVRNLPCQMSPSAFRLDDTPPRYKSLDCFQRHLVGVEGRILAHPWEPVLGGTVHSRATAVPSRLLVHSWYWSLSILPPLT